MTRTGSFRKTPASPVRCQSGLAFQGALLLLAILAVAGAALLTTPLLIKPFPSQAPWYESAATFPRAALALVVMAALVEFLIRRKGHRAGQTSSGSDELDSSLARPALALASLALFVAYASAVPVLGFGVSTFGFLSACGFMLKLPRVRVIIFALLFSLALWIIFVKTLKVAFGHGWFL
jgi:Tripartite tricarboxylate transporter TctB family